MTTILAKLKMRRGTAAEWAASNPVLAEGELAFETDTGRTKIGNGVTGYSALPSYPTLDEMLEAQGIVQGAVDDAEAAETNAAASASAAATSATASQTAATAAGTSASAAAASATAASASAAAALGSASNAQSDRIAAQAASTTANNAKGLAQAAQLAAEAARDQAQAAETGVAGVVSEAETSAEAAYQSAVAAVAAATTATANRQATFADREVTTADRTAAAASASAAAASEVAADASADAAGTSAIAAAGSATTAQSARDVAVAAKTAAEGSATAASTSANAASASASAAAGSATAAANSATTSTNNASATAADRTATGLDRTVAAASASEASASQTAAATSAAAAASSASAASASAATATTKASEASTSATSAAASAASAEASKSAAATSAFNIETSYGGLGNILDKSDQATAAAVAAAGSAEAANFSQLSAAQSALIASTYSVASGLDTATRNAQAAASLAQGYAASASSVVQQDLSGITAQALHRSPNAITAMAIYDTSRDSDGGAWTEKCQHTSWWNEALSGKWLGAQTSEFNARVVGATLGSETVVNGSFAADTDWVKPTGVTISGGALNFGPSAVQFGSVSQVIAGLASTNAGKTYKIVFTVTNYVSGTIGIANSASPLFTATANGTYEFYYTVPSGLANGGIYIQGRGATGTNSFSVDNISVREVTAINTASNDYFQLTTDGKFYRLWKNHFSWSEDFSNAAWLRYSGAPTAITANAAVAPDGTTTADKLYEGNAVSVAHWIYRSVSANMLLTFSCYVKAAERSWAFMQLGQSLTGAYFDLQNGVVGSLSAGTINATIQSVGNGWYRCSVTRVIEAAGGSAGVVTSTANNVNSYAGDGVSGIYIWGAQLEYGSTATAYEPKAAEGSASEVFRGNKADFPRLAAIVAEASNVNIYDLTEPGRPMWMRFVGILGQTNILNSGMRAGLASVSASQSRLCIAGSNSASGTAIINFSTDGAATYNNTVNTRGNYRGNIGQRHANSGYDNADGFALTNSSSHSAVAMAVLPDAPIDPATGLRVPTIAVATAAGFSIIKHNGSVVSSATTSPYGSIAIDKNYVIASRNDSSAKYGAFNPNALANSFAVSMQFNGGAPDAVFTTAGKLVRKQREEFLINNSSFVSLLKNHETNFARGLGNRIANTHNTGWMTGDIRRAYLSDVDVGTITGPELIVNGTFETVAAGQIGYDNGDGTIVGWSRQNSAISLAIVGNAIVATNVVGGGIAWGYPVTVTAGRRYRVRATSSGVGNNMAVTSGSPATSFAPQDQLAWGSVNRDFTATITGTVYVIFGSGGGVGDTRTVDNVSVREVVQDRSYFAAALNTTGTLTRAALATGTSLVGYSGFSAANYLREPYSADLDFGTGEWSCSAWVNVPGTLSALSTLTALGPNQIANGSFDSGLTSWQVNNSNGTTHKVTVSGGKAVFSSAGGTTLNLSQNCNLQAGRSYRLTFEVSNKTGADNIRVRAGASSVISDISSNGSHTLNFSYNTNSGDYINFYNATNNTLTFEIDNIVLTEILPFCVAERAHSSGAKVSLALTPGGFLAATAFDGTTTRTVTTAAAYNTATWLKAEACYTLDGTLSIRVNGREVVTSRGNPLLSLSSRYNQVLYSQDFANAAWLMTAGFSSKASTAVTDPLGGTTACEIAFIAANGSLQQQSVFTVGKTYTISFWSRRDAGSNVLRVATNTGTSLATFSPTSSWQKFTFTVTVSSGNHILFQDTSSSGWTNVQFAFVQVEEGSTAKTYQRVGAATDFDFAAPLTIGNNFAADAPFPGSIALLKLSATVPTYEQSQFMYEQEKQLFRAGAQSVLPDSGSIVDMAYDDATDRWVAISATNESYWTGLVRNSVTPVPAGSYTRVVAGSGLELVARSTTNPGVDVTIPAYGLREELVKHAEAAARLTKEIVTYDYVGGFTANTTNGSTAISNVSTITYPASYIGACISGAGIPANTTIVAVSGTTIYLSAAATATASGVSISFLDFALPVGMEARTVFNAGVQQREGATSAFTRLYDGFIETIRFGVAPGATALVSIQAQRITMQ